MITINHPRLFRHTPPRGQPAHIECIDNIMVDVSVAQRSVSVDWSLHTTKNRHFVLFAALFDVVAIIHVALLILPAQDSSLRLNALTT